LAIAAAVARFLGVESCGQCAHCKRDGLALDSELHALLRGDADADADRVPQLLRTVTEGARCNLAAQQPAVVGSLRDRFPQAFVHGRQPVGRTVTIAPILDIHDGHAEFDEYAATKQPDWSHDPIDSGRW